MAMSLQKLAFSRIDFFISIKANKFCLFSPVESRISSFYLPSVFFYSLKSQGFGLLFLSYFSYSSFLAHLASFIQAKKAIYFLRLRLRGLGYRIRRYTNNFYRFYFTRTNYIYFHVPPSLLVRRRKKRLFLFSTNYHLVRLVFANLMLLHKVGPYNRRGFTYPRQITLLKAIKKIV